MAGSVKSGVLEFSDEQKVFVAVDEDDVVKKAVLIDREGNETALGALPTDEQVQEAVDAWLDDHPEATTTVQDGAVTTAKLANGSVTDDKLAADGIKAEVSDLKSDLDGKLPFDEVTETYKTTETAITFPYVGELNVLGNINEIQGESVTDYIDLTNVIGIYRTGTTTKFTLWRYCLYDENKTFLEARGETTDYDIVQYDGKYVTWLDLTDLPTGTKYLRTYKADSRPYTYYNVSKTDITHTYDIPKILVDGVNPLKFMGKKIVTFGDSIFGNYRDTDETNDKSISKMIADATGATVYNAGFGGCRMATAFRYWDAFSMHSLADSIASGDWTVQDDAIEESDEEPEGGTTKLLDYFPTTLAMLKTIDWSEIDYITIGYGTNDYMGNVYVDPLDIAGFKEWDSFSGALKYSIDKILTAYPNIRIIVISPCWRWFLSGGEYSYSSDDSQSANTHGDKLIDYVEACEEACNEYHVACIDTYRTLGFNQWTISEYFPILDGTHPKQAGRQLRADRIIGQMNALF